MLGEVLAVVGRFGISCAQSILSCIAGAILSCIGLGIIGVMIWLGVQKRVGSDGGKRRSVWVGAPRTAIKLTIRPLLYDSFSWSYKTIFMFVVVLVFLCTRVSWHEGVPPGDSPTHSAPQDWV